MRTLGKARDMSRTAIVLGKGKLAIRIAEWFRTAADYELVTVVPVVPEPDWTDSIIDWCRSTRTPFVESGHFVDIPGADDEDWRVDLGISVTYDRIFPEWFIAKCRRLLNIHNSPLPCYRGVSPINWALKNQESMHGVTVHEIGPGIDDGPIVAQLLYSVYPEFDEVRDVYARALEYGWVLFEQTMPILEQIEPQPQVEADASHYTRAQDELLGERRSFTRDESR
jgi:methionyl-tRNA formyltransferase